MSITKTEEFNFKSAFAGSHTTGAFNFRYTPSSVTTGIGQMNDVIGSGTSLVGSVINVENSDPSTVQTEGLNFMV